MPHRDGLETLPAVAGRCLVHCNSASLCRPLPCALMLCQLVPAAAYALMPSHSLLFLQFMPQRDCLKWKAAVAKSAWIDAPPAISSSAKLQHQALKPAAAAPQQSLTPLPLCMQSKQLLQTHHVLVLLPASLATTSSSLVCCQHCWQPPHPLSH